MLKRPMNVDALSLGSASRTIQVTGTITGIGRTFEEYGYAYMLVMSFPAAGKIHPLGEQRAAYVY